MLDDEAAKEAKAQLEAMGENVHFRSPRKRRMWLIVIGVVALLGIGLGAIALRAQHRREAARARTLPDENNDNKEGGCPCGCDRSARMAAELRQAQERAPGAIAATLVTIAERESVGYITERMIEHRLRMLDLADELHVAVDVRGARLTERAAIDAAARCDVASTSAIGRAVRVCSELVVHGERTEIVDHHDKLITSSFRLWLELENRTDAERVIQRPTIEAGSVHLPVSRWYDERGAGEPWNGVLGPGETVRVNVIGDIPEHIAPGTVVDATIRVDDVAISTRAKARADIHLLR